MADRRIDIDEGTEGALAPTDDASVQAGRLDAPAPRPRPPNTQAIAEPLARGPLLESAQLEKARLGDVAAFDALVTAHRPALLRVARRFVGDADDTEDVVQDALLRAYQRIGQLRSLSRLAGWLKKIVVRASIDHLRTKKRWRADAQVHARTHLHATPEGEAAITSRFASVEHRFDAREHIGFCFTCVARSLPADQQAALIVRDVLGYTSARAGRLLRVNEAKLRHTLVEARAAMQNHFDGLCGIVSKTGVCYQCAGLRDAARPAAQGPAVPSLGGDHAPRDERYRHRLRVVTDVDVHAGAAQSFHDHLWKTIRDIEQRQV